MKLGMDTAGYYREVCKKHVEVCMEQIPALCNADGNNVKEIIKYVNNMYDCAMIIDRIHLGELSHEEIEKIEVWEATNIEYTQKWVPKDWDEPEVK